MTSKAAASMYAPTGTSVRGGCRGLPAQPRKPLKVRPRIVSAGRKERCRMGGLLVRRYPVPAPAQVSGTKDPAWSLQSVPVREVLLVALGQGEQVGVGVEHGPELPPRLFPLGRDVLGGPVALVGAVALQDVASHRGLVDLVDAVG